MVVRLLMTRRVIRPTTDLDNRQGPQQWTMDRSKWIERTVYRIEWADGASTETGLFSARVWAEKYADQHGWEIGIDQSEEEMAV
jgi:hypothetical protein